MKLSFSAVYFFLFSDKITDQIPPDITLLVSLLSTYSPVLQEFLATALRYI
jgi:hypothetical protein